MKLLKIYVEIRAWACQGDFVLKPVVGAPLPDGQSRHDTRDGIGWNEKRQPRPRGWRLIRD